MTRQPKFNNEVHHGGQEELCAPSNRGHERARDAVKFRTKGIINPDGTAKPGFVEKAKELHTARCEQHDVATRRRADIKAARRERRQRRKELRNK